MEIKNFRITNQDGVVHYVPLTVNTRIVLSDDLLHLACEDTLISREYIFDDFITRDEAIRFVGCFEIVFGVVV